MFCLDMNKLLCVKVIEHVYNDGSKTAFYRFPAKMLIPSHEVHHWFTCFFLYLAYLFVNE